MKEYRVDCFHPIVHLPDLGITLKRGETAWIQEEALRSPVLKALRSIGAVSVNEGRRCETMRIPPPPSVRIPRQTGAVIRKKPLDASAPPSAPPEQMRPVSAEEIDAKIERAVDRMAERLALVLSRAPAQQSGDPALLAQAVSEAVAKSLQNITLAAGGVSSRGASSDDPLYIPSGLVSESAGDIPVASAAAESGGLDDAATALRKSRKKTST